MSDPNHTELIARLRQTSWTVEAASVIAKLVAERADRDRKSPTIEDKLDEILAYLKEMSAFARGAAYETPQRETSS